MSMYIVTAYLYGFNYAFVLTLNVQNFPPAFWGRKRR
jgi:hypothetical protein